MADDDCGMCELHAAMLQDLSRQLDEMQAKLESAEARNAASERDARRYRFLVAPFSDDPYGNHWGEAYNAVGDGTKTKAETDAAVDAAIDAHAQGQAGGGDAGMKLVNDYATTGNLPNR